MEPVATVLLIAPEDSWTRELYDCLTTRDIAVIWHPDVMAGVEAAQQHQPNVIVVDETAQPLAPAETGKLLRSKAPYVPLALLGSPATPEAMEYLEAAGYDLLVRRGDPLPLVAAQIQAVRRTHDVIENLVIANRRLVRLTATDSLTGLLNHKRLLEWLEIEFKRAQRNAEPLSCIMVDIDHFKHVNDVYGHKAGDRVLQEFSSLLRANIRKTDIVGRYGGEEFLVILPNTAASGAVNLSEKMRAIVEQLVVKEDGKQISITASFGIASTSDGRIFNHDQLLQLTDKALYMAKNSGRNRVCSLTETAPGADLAVEPLPYAQQPSRPVPMAAVLVGPSGAPHEALARLIEKCGFEIINIGDAGQLFDRALQEACDIIILDPSVSKVDRRWVSERLRSGVEPFFPLVVVATTRDGADATTSRKKLGETGEVVSLEDLEQVLAPLLRTLYRQKVLREEVRKSQAKTRALQKRLARGERLRALSEIATGVAHDLNDALTVILGRSQMLLDNSSDYEVRKESAAIEHAAQDAAMSVRRIMDFFRPEAKDRFAPHFLDNLVQQCLEVAKARWKEEAHLRGIRYEIATQIPRRLRVWANETELSEAFNNLIFNALDAMPKGGKLTIFAEEENGTVLIRFTDTGTGMSKDVLDKIFDPFFTTKTDRGTGLGLSLVRSIVLRHKGEIDVKSKPGEGTTFLIRLPAYTEQEKVGAASAAVAELADQSSAAPEGPVRVLLIDDEPSVLDTYSDVLASRGYDVTIAATGREALQKIQAAQFDVVVTDLSIPDVPGLDVIAEARKALPTVRCVVMTGWGDSISEDALREIGVDSVLPKPVPIKSLLDLMEKVGRPCSSRQD
ncbi:diguanylate cyclase [Candidatus Sumerlaeota bacterium]|nr:diguanylate cyclase [Candidatus Sumerlaeota bacterium]